MPSVVKIELQMDENGVVTGFRNIDAAGTKVVTTFKAVATSGTQMGSVIKSSVDSSIASMSALQAAVEANTAAMQAMGQKGGAAVRSVGGHALNSMDSVRLFRDEFGIHIPRSMEKTMASSKLVMSVLSSMQTLMIGFGAIGIFAALGSEAYRFGVELFAVDDTVLKFNQDLSNTARIKFMDTASIEDVRDQLRGATTDLANYDSQLAKLPKNKIGEIAEKSKGGAGLASSLLGPPGEVINVVRAYRDKTRQETDDKRDQAQKDADNLTLRTEDERHKRVMSNLEAEGKLASAIENPAARAKRERELAGYRNSENQAHNKQVEVEETTIVNRTRDKDHQLKVDPNAGAAERAQADALAGADQYAKLTEYARQEADEVRKIDREANNTSLRGYQLLEAQRLQAREDFIHKYGASTIALQAIDKRYQEEEKRASDELTRELQRNAREAQLGGMTGIAQTEQRSRNRDADIDDQLASGKFAAYGDPAKQQAAADAEKLTNHQETNREIEEEEKRFNESIASMAEASANRQVQGFAKIKSETSRQLDDLQKKFDEVYGGIHDVTDPAYLSGLAQLNRGKASVTASAQQDTSDLTRKNAEETAKIEAEAYRSSLPQMQQHEQEIIDQYNERTAAYRRMLDDQLISQTDFDKRTAAAAREMNAQLAADAKAQRDKIASELEPFMGAHPLQALEKFGQHQAAEITAGYLQSATNGNTPFLGKGKKSTSFADLLTGRHHDAVNPGHAAGQAVAEMTISAATVHLTAGTIVGGGTAGGGSIAGTSTGLISTTGGGASSSATGMVARASTPAFGSMASQSSAAFFGNAKPAAAATTAETQTAQAAGSYGLLSAPEDASWTGGAAIQGAGPGGLITTDSAASGVPASTAAKTFAAGTPDSMKVLGGVNSTISDAKQIQGISDQIKGVNGAVGGAASTVNKKTSSLLDGKTGTALSGGAALFGAVESDGGFGGALQGAAAGAKLGGMLGPEGAAIGAGVGALVGVLGIGGRQKAEDYDRKQVRPRIAADLLQFNMGAMPYQQAYDDIDNLDHDAEKAISKMGPGAMSFYNDHIKQEVSIARSTLTREQKAGRSQYGMTAAQFDSGGLIRGFGDYATSSNQGFIHAKIGETVMHEGATETHGDALALMLGGASRSQMAGYYNAKSMAPTYSAAMQNSAFGGSGHTFNYGATNHINALDAKSVSDLLMDQKHTIRGAYNASYAENSGGADLV